MGRITAKATLDRIMQDVEDISQAMAEIGEMLNYIKEIIAKHSEIIVESSAVVYEKYITQSAIEGTTNKKAVVNTFNGEKVVPVGFAKRQILVKGGQYNKEPKAQQTPEEDIDILTLARNFALLNGRDKVKKALQEVGHAKVSDIIKIEDKKRFLAVLNEEQEEKQEEKQEERPF